MTTVRVIRTRAEFAEIRTAWMDLRAEHPGGSPCLHWHWVDRFWEEMLPPDADVAVITLWSGETLLGAAPLVIHRRRGLGLDAIAGMENPHTIYYEWLLPGDRDAAGRAGHEIARAMADLTARRGIVSWRNAPDCPATDMARSALRATGWWVVWRSERPHRVVHFPNGAKPLIASLSANARSRLKKGSRRLEQMGVNFAEISGEADIRDGLRALWELEFRSWKGQAGTSVYQDERARAFYDSLALSLRPERRFVLFSLMCGGRLVASIYALVEDSCLYGLKLSYDSDFARASPGHVVILRVIEWAEKHGISSLDLGRDSEFKSYWGGTLQPKGTVRAFPPGVRGTATMVTAASAAAIRRLTRFAPSRQ